MGYPYHYIKSTIILICYIGINNLCFASNNKPTIDLSKANDTIWVSNIYLSGNIKTKPRIILNELLFKKNKPLLKADFYKLLGKSHQNLQNTSLFNFVHIDYWLIDNQKIAFEIKVDERWYTWALPLFEHADRNFSAFLENGDWNRINYGVYLKQENFRGMNEILKFKLRVGYLNEAELLFISSNRNNKLGWGSTMIYHAHNQVSYGIFNNEAIYIKTPNTFIEQKLSTEIYMHYRHEFVNRHKLSLKYHNYYISDTLAKLNPDYLLNGNTSLAYFSLKYLYNLDLRDSKAYPLKGHMFEGSITQSGLALHKNDINNLSLELFFQQYGQLYKRFYYGINYGGILNSNNNNPFIISNGLGYKEFLNGYEYNVIESDNYTYSKQKILFELLPPKTANINFINLNQFSKFHYAIYLKTFFDSGYVYKHNPDNTNSLSNTFLYSYGVGVDLVTYYDKVLSINYAINKLGFKGVYIHLDIAM